MKEKSRANKGQFSIIAALLVAIILVAAVIMTYATIRNSPLQEPPEVLSSTGEINRSINEILEFSAGYYCAILQVTGNSTYAKDKTSSYLQSGFVHIARSRPEWNPSFDIHSSPFSIFWFAPTSYSMGNVSVTYSLSSLGIEGIRYETSCLLNVTILGNMGGKAKVLVMREENKPDITLGKENFLFYYYCYSSSTWNLIHSASDPEVFSNGTYLVQIPSGVDQTAYSLQVVDLRGIKVTAFYSSSIPSSIPQYAYTLTWDSRYSSLTGDTIVVENLQNGTLRWLGQNLELTTQGRPIPPIPVKAFHVNQTIDGVNQEVPFQVEDWGSDTRVPLGMASNASIFGSRNTIVFLVDHHVQNVTLWWDGRDNANQTSYATTNRYFDDKPEYNPDYGLLTNGILTLKIVTRSGGSEVFRAETSMGASNSTANFMRINGKLATPGVRTAAYMIYNGTVRDIVQQEVEWDNDGAPGCPDVYSQIVLTLPANATYYTYALRTIFVNSSQSRTITDLSAIQLSSEQIQGLRSLTENGTIGGFPVVVETYPQENRMFYNFSNSETVWAHHWSEYVKDASGAGIMFTNSSNLKLYAFDGIANEKTGALNATNEGTGTVQWITPAAVYDKCGESGSDVATNAIDGDTGTYWRHDSTCNHWIVFDMGETKNVSKIRIYQSSLSSHRWGQSDGIEVYVSDDPNNWGSAVWTGTLDSWGWQQSGEFQAQGRYIKLRSKSNSKNQRLYELEVFEIRVGVQRVVIEFNPVARFNASFTHPKDVTWHGAVVTFDSGSAQDTIYPSSGGNIGLWVIVEYPPSIAVS